jgi:hypothetical protein
MTDRTRSKSRKVIISDAFMCSDSEDELPLLQPRSISMPAQLHQVRMDIPSISDETRISLQVLPARSLQPPREALTAGDASDQFEAARQATSRSRRRLLRATNFFLPVWMQRGTDPSSSEGDMDAIQGQQAACNNHRDTMGALKVQVLRSPNGVCKCKHV